MTTYSIMLLDLIVILIQICKFNDLELSREIEDLQSENEIEDIESESEIEDFVSENIFTNEIKNPNSKNYHEFKNDLCHWYVNNCISHKALTNLLVIFRELC